MDSKYYIPTIEEIRSGFEYQKLKSNGTWKTVKEFSNDYDYEDNPHYGIMKDIEGGEIRVKYLDEEDIKELGVAFAYQEYGGVCSMSGRFKNKQSTGISFDEYWFVMYDLPHIVIYTTDKANNTVLFDGFIKNKSELKVLLKQLGING